MALAVEARVVVPVPMLAQLRQSCLPTQPTVAESLGSTPLVMLASQLFLTPCKKCPSSSQAKHSTKIQQMKTVTYIDGVLISNTCKPNTNLALITQPITLRRPVGLLGIRTLGRGTKGRATFWSLPKGRLVVSEVRATFWSLPKGCQIVSEPVRVRVRV